MPEDCVFCRIVAGSIPSTIIFSDEHTVAFPDLHPQATVHLLVVPREHYTDIADLGRDPVAAAGLVAGIRGLVTQQKLTDFRTVFNTGAGAGQSVFHVHAHVLAGKMTGLLPG